MHVPQKVSVLLRRSLPVDSLSKLLDRAAFLEIKVALAHQPDHLLAHVMLLVKALLVHVNQFLKLLCQSAPRSGN